MPQNAANTQDLVEIENIRENTLILKDGSLRQVVMVGGVNFALKSEEEQNLITQAYQNFLNSLNFQIQIVIHSRKINIERYLQNLEEYKAKEQSALLQDQISEYQEFIRRFVADNAIMSKTFFAVVPFYPLSASLPAKNALEFLPFLRKKPPADASAAEAAAGKEFQENLLQLAQRVNQVVEGLAQIGLEAVVLNDEQLLELFYNFYNPESVEKEKISAPEQ
jgi:type IV secretory pathway VirB4 component